MTSQTNANLVKTTSSSNCGVASDFTVTYQGRRLDVGVPGLNVIVEHEEHAVDGDHVLEPLPHHQLRHQVRPGVESQAEEPGHEEERLERGEAQPNEEILRTVPASETGDDIIVLGVLLSLT